MFAKYISSRPQRATRREERTLSHIIFNCAMIIEDERNYNIRIWLIVACPIIYLS